MDTIKPKRIYKKINSTVIAEHQTKALLTNNTDAVRQLDSDYKTDYSIQQRGYKINKKSQGVNALDYIDKKMDEIGIIAINRVKELTQSDNESIATKNSHFVIDHIRGKAVQKTDNRNLNISIETILD